MKKCYCNYCKREVSLTQLIEFAISLISDVINNKRVLKILKSLLRLN